MPLGLIAKIAAATSLLLAITAVAEALPVGAKAPIGNVYETAQYYQPGPYRQGYERRYYEPSRTDPAHICEQRGGDIYRIPSKHVKAIDVRQVDRGIYQVTLSIRGQVAYCTADTRGNVLGFQ